MKTASEFCESLLSCAQEHGTAEGYEMWIGDLEDFFRAAFELLTDEQRDRFWDTPAVARTVQDILGYQELAAEIYGIEDQRMRTNEACERDDPRTA
jgi:hypothetical protein